MLDVDVGRWTLDVSANKQMPPTPALSPSRRWGNPTTGGEGQNSPRLCLLNQLRLGGDPTPAPLRLLAARLLKRDSRAGRGGRFHRRGPVPPAGTPCLPV